MITLLNNAEKMELIRMYGLKLSHVFSSESKIPELRESAERIIEIAQTLETDPEGFIKS